MKSKTDLNVDKMLREVYEAYHRQVGGVGYGHMFDYLGNQYDSNSGSNIAKILHEHKLIRWMGYPDKPEHDMMYIEVRGENIQQNGGWLAHLKRLSEPNSIMEKDEYAIDKKPIKKYIIKSDLSEWFSKYWWGIAVPVVVAWICKMLGIL